MMRLVDDQQIPVCCNRVRRDLSRISEQWQSAEHELTVEKRIHRRITFAQCFTSFLVEDREEQIESSEQFHEPLVDERLGDDDEHPRRAAGQVQPVKNHSRFDRLAETDLIREEDARHQASGHFADYGHLMREKIDPASDISAYWRLTDHAPAMQGLGTQVERRLLVDLAGQETFHWRTEADRIAELRFGH